MLSLLLPLAMAGDPSPTTRAPDWQDAAPVPLDQIDSRLLLVGDPGWGDGDRKGYLAPDAPPDCVLALASETAAQLPDRSLVLMLGDTVYGDHKGLLYGGFPANAAQLPYTRLRCRKDQPDCAMEFSLEEEQVLAQLDPIGASGAPGLWIPGNHEYYAAGYLGLAREEVFIKAYAQVYQAPLEMVPVDGCPGPVSVPVGDKLTVVAYDAMSWLGNRSPLPVYRRVNRDLERCPTRKDDAFEKAIQAQLAQAAAEGRYAVAASHHPFVTWGKHGHKGAAYAWMSQQEVNSGSLKRLQRRVCGATGADPASCKARTVRPEAPHLLASVAGHDHGLQVLPGTASGFRHELVSGSGTLSQAGHGSVQYPGDGAASFVSNQAGFMVLDVLVDGRVRLDVHEVDPSCAVTHHATWLEE